MARGIKMHERSAYWIQSIDAHRCASPSEWLCGFDELANWTLFEWIRLLGMWVAQLTNLTNLMIRQTYLFIHWNWLFFDHSNYRISCQSINAFEFESKWEKRTNQHDCMCCAWYRILITFSMFVVFCGTVLWIQWNLLVWCKWMHTLNGWATFVSQLAILSNPYYRHKTDFRLKYKPTKNAHKPHVSET